MFSSSNNLQNPFFSTFGKVVEHLFVSNTQTDGVPIHLSWRPDTETDTEISEEPILAHHIDQEEVKKIQKEVDIIQRSLESTTSSSVGMNELRIHFRDFRTALKSGNEALMEENPFYELTQRIFQLNLLGMVSLYCSKLVHLTKKAPRPAWSIISLPEIWSSHSTVKGGVLSRIGATFTSLFLSGKSVLDGLLFLLSATTTAWAVNNLLTSLEIMALLLPTNLLDGNDVQLVQYSLSGVAGCALSMIVLDFKARLLQGVAERGFFFQGILDAFARQPRWMLMATLFTLLSFFTNYQAIVSLISIKADLSQQSKIIQDQVHQALGGWHEGDGVRPASLHDFHAALNLTIQEIGKKFASIAEDEIRVNPNKKSRVVPQKGSRYFAKLFILEGGYEPGVRDVVRRSQANAYARNIDKIIFDSKVNLSLSLNDKLTAIRGEYEINLAQTDNIIQTQLAQLIEMISLTGGPVEIIQRLFSLDGSQVHAVLQKMIAELEANLIKFQEAANQLQTLTSRYMTLVGQLDNALSSGVANTSPIIQEKKVVIPEIKAIKDLKNIKIALIKPKNFIELKFFLIENYGVGSSFVLLALILLTTILMDMGTLFIYGGRVAAFNAVDRRSFAKRMTQLKEFEEEFVTETKKYFDRADIQWVLTGLNLPDHNELHNALFRYCEDVNPLLKDKQEQLGAEGFNRWLSGLFSLPKNSDMTGYNLRSQVLHGLISGLDQQFSKFIKLFYPGLYLRRGMGGLEFQEFFNEIKEGYQQEKNAFLQDLQRITEEITSKLPMTETLLDVRQVASKGELSAWQKNWEAKIAPLFKKKRKKPQSLIQTKKPTTTKKGVGLAQIVTSLLYGSFKEQVAPFAHTRRNWLMKLAIEKTQPLQPVAQITTESSSPYLDETGATPQENETVLQNVIVKSSMDGVHTTEEVVTNAMTQLVNPVEDLSKMRAQPALITPAENIPMIRAPLTKSFDSNALFLTSQNEELSVLVTEVMEDTARLQLSQIPLSVTLASEGQLILITEHGGRYPFSCRIEQMNDQTLSIRLLSSDPLFATLYATLPPLPQKSFLYPKQTLFENSTSVEDDEPETLDIDHGNESFEAPTDQEPPLTEAVVIEAATDSVENACQKIRQELWKIQIRGIELRKMRPSPQTLLRILNKNDLLLQQMPKSVDNILARLSAMLSPEMVVPKEGKISYLSKLAGEAMDLLDQIQAVADVLEDPNSRERRLTSALLDKMDGAGGQTDRSREIGTENGGPSKQSFRISLQPVGGGFFTGIAGDLTRNGLRMVADDPFDGVMPKIQGLLKFIGNSKTTGFKVEVVRVAENEAIIRVIEDTKRFETLAHQGAFGNLVCEQWDL